MPIINVPVKPWIQPPYRNKLVKAGGLRNPEDFSRISIHQQSNGRHLIAHDIDHGSVVIEVHDCWDDEGNEGENCRMESFELDSEQRYELALYLLSTVNRV